MNDFKAQISIENGGGNYNDIYHLIENTFGWAMYKDTEAERDKVFKQRQSLFDRLVAEKEINCDKYYLPDGTKITKPLKALLTELGVTKAEFQTHWAQVCSTIAEMFVQIEAEVEMKSQYFGSGKFGAFGDSDSCFQEGGCNMYNGVFIDVSPSCGTLLVRPILPPGLTDQQKRAKYGKGRMICWIENSTTAWLMNDYTQYQRREIPRNIFVRALEALSDTKITFKRTSEDSALPIFINNTPYRCTATEGTFDKLTTDYRWACPICSKKFEPGDVHTDIDNNTYMVGCSDSCMHEQAEYDRYNCVNCNSNVYDDEVRFVEGDAYCPDCYYDMYYCCECCNEDVEKDRMVGVENYQYDTQICEVCIENHATECHECGVYVFHGGDAKRIVMTEIDGELYCNTCVATYCFMCDGCDEMFHRADGHTASDDTGPRCYECHADYEREEETG